MFDVGYIKGTDIAVLVGIVVALARLVVGIADGPVKRRRRPRIRAEQLPTQRAKNRSKGPVAVRRAPQGHATPPDVPEPRL